MDSTTAPARLDAPNLVPADLSALRLPLILVLLGLGIMYVPTFIDLFQGVWGTTEQAHGPLVFGISLWLFYKKWPDALQRVVPGNSNRYGWPILALGLALYIVGRSQSVVMFEVGSVIWVLLGICLIQLGSRASAALAFPLFFMLFMIPMPGVVVDALTMPMKMAVSYVAEHLLFNIGYPIARTGVMLQIGPYQLLVADACAGLHTLFSLEALGLLYLNVIRHESVQRNIALAIMIVPISFTANVIRVIVLTLITYYLGDEAGQGFLHGFAGMVLFLTALLLIIGVDSLARLVISHRAKKATCTP